MATKSQKSVKSEPRFTAEEIRDGLNMADRLSWPSPRPGLPGVRVTWAPTELPFGRGGQEGKIGKLFSVRVELPDDGLAFDVRNDGKTDLEEQLLAGILEVAKMLEQSARGLRLIQNAHAEMAKAK
jgi:hypothetical protein